MIRHDHDLAGALAISGRPVDNLMRALHLYVDTDDDHDGRVVIRDTTGEPVAVVGAKDAHSRARRGRDTETRGKGDAA